MVEMFGVDGVLFWCVFDMVGIGIVKEVELIVVIVDMYDCDDFVVCVVCVVVCGGVLFVVVVGGV